MNKYIRICILLQQKKTRSSLTRRYKQGCTQYKRHRRLVEQAGNQYSTHFPIFARFHSDPLLSRGAIDQCRPAETRANPATTITQCVPPSVRRATRIQPRVRRECGAFAPPPDSCSLPNTRLPEITIADISRRRLPDPDPNPNKLLQQTGRQRLHVAAAPSK